MAGKTLAIYKKGMLELDTVRINIASNLDYFLHGGWVSEIDHGIYADNWQATGFTQFFYSLEPPHNALESSRYTTDSVMYFFRTIN
ncbi:unnamed protein product [marine sediment metagenome]|uniref:Uncharacterized protein n=1 Tax=marine sediment metagenome TaxID=412755 RepID=X1TJB0_9ZZZZ